MVEENVGARKDRETIRSWWEKHSYLYYSKQGALFGIECWLLFQTIKTSINDRDKTCYSLDYDSDVIGEDGLPIKDEQDYSVLLQRSLNFIIFLHCLFISATFFKVITFTLKKAGSMPLMQCICVDCKVYCSCWVIIYA